LKYLSLSLLLWLLVLNSAIAERSESIMFQSNPSPFMATPRENDDEAEKCTHLIKQIEALKGKPQRRKAALERYRLMCSDKTQLE
jgi:hypothetical protein